MTTMRLVDGGGGPYPDQIPVNGRPMRDVSQDLLDAIVTHNDPPELYVRAGQLVRVRCDEKGRPIVDHVTETLLRHRLGAITNTVRVDRDGKPRHCAPPMDHVRDVLARGTWPVPALEAVTEIPTLRPDGTIHAAAGYDPATCLVHVPTRGLQVPDVPDTPTAGAVLDATDLLDELLCDFPFDGPADKANAIAVLLTPLVRPAVPDHIPMALIDAPEPGTGKGLLTDLVGLIATGRTTSKKPLPAHDDEIRKMITSTLAEGSTVVVLDNVDDAIKSPSLAGVLTAETWADRILGRSEIIQLPNRATWIATGNNISVAGDLARRCYRIRLDAHQARPWARGGFRHDPLLPWVARRRGDLLAALLTIARAWWHAGQPPAPDAPTLGTFTPWARTIAGILHHADIEGFLANQRDFLDTADAEAVEWEAFLEAWIDRASGPVTLAQITELLRHDDTFAVLLPGNLGDHLTKETFTRRLGAAIKKRAGRHYADLQVAQRGETRNKVALWRVLRTDEEPPPTTIKTALFGDDAEPDPANPARHGADHPPRGVTDPAPDADPAADPARENPTTTPPNPQSRGQRGQDPSFAYAETNLTGPPGKTDPANPAEPAPPDTDHEPF